MIATETALPMRQALLALVLLAAAAARALALDPSRALSQEVHGVWQQGLPQSSVTAIAQTRDGYLWFGTEEGLVRFDGVRMTVFDPRNTPEIRHGYVQCLFEDRDAALWLGTLSGGVVRYSGGAFRSWTTREGLSNDRVLAVAQTADGSLWFGTSAGLDRLSHGKITSWGARLGLSHGAVNSLVAAPDGGLWVGTSQGLLRLRGGMVEGWSTRQGLSSNQVTALCEDSDGALWIGTSGGGLDRWKDGRITVFDGRNGLSGTEVRAILRDRDGNLWVGTVGGGLGRLRKDRFEMSGPAQSLTGDIVFALCEDREGSLWVGVDGGGLNRYRDGKFAVTGTSEGLAHDIAYAVLEDSRGRLWIGTNGGASVLEGGTIRNLTPRDGLANAMVRTFCEDREGAVWIGTNGGGLARWKEGRLTAVTARDGLSSDRIWSSLAEENGDLWFGTNGGGLELYRGGKFRAFGPAEGLGSNVVYAIARDARGTLWVGTLGGGLAALQPDGRFRSFTHRDGLSSDMVLALHPEKDGSLWVGTNGGGLDLFRGGRFTAVTSRDGLFDDTILQILDDGRGSLWMSSNRGIFRVSRQALEDFAAGRARRIACEDFGLADGLRSVECNGGNQPAGARTRDGRLWFPTVKGVAVVDPAHLPSNPLAPPVVIEGLRVDGRPVPPSRPGIGLPPGGDKYEFDYTALSLAAPERVRFRYRLEGFDRGWIDAGGRRTAYYTRIPHGRYRFRVIACNDDGVWNPHGAALAFSVAPFFYETWWFFGLGAIALAGAGAGGYRWRVRRLVRRERELEDLVARRTSELQSAYEAVRRSEEELRLAQEKIERLSSSSAGMLEDTTAWARGVAAEIARAIGAREIGVWLVENERILPLASGSTRPPTWERLRRSRESGEIAALDGETVIPVLGMTGESRGALVIDGPEVVWGEVQRRLVSGFAHYLGTALELRLLREKLTAAEARRAATRREMHQRGIATVALCPQCGRCFPHAEDARPCPDDGTPLDSSRLLPLRLNDRYRLERLLGEGGMGTVFRAYDERLARDVAVKIIRSEYLNDAAMRFRLEREARTVARIRHPGVIALYDSGEIDDGSAYLVMELLGGRDLADVLADFGPGTPAQVAALLRQAAAGVDAAHRAGVIHRDLKPANIFLTPVEGGFQAKVLDFGLAKSALVDARLTTTGMVVGTPNYMAPEQVQGKEAVEASDLYSLAAVAYEALTGRKAIAGGSAVGQLMIDVQTVVPPPVSALRPGMPSGVDAAFAGALAKKPSDRPAGLLAWAEATAAALEKVPADAFPGWPADLLAAREAGAAPAASQRTEKMERR